jgi:hypothetical protein
LLDLVLSEGGLGDLTELELFVTSGDGQTSSASWLAD